MTPPLIKAVINNDIVECRQLIVTKEADVNGDRGIDGATALRWAAKKGYLEIAELLISLGADVNIEDIYGRTSIHWAASSGFLNVVQLLLSNGADINIKDNGWWRALISATIRGNSELVQLLLLEERDFSTAKDKGSTALDISRRRSYVEVVDCLCNWPLTMVIIILQEGLFIFHHIDCSSINDLRQYCNIQ